MESITDAEVERFRAIQKRLHEQDKAQRQQEVERQNRECDKCCNVTMACLFILVVAFVFLYTVAPQPLFDNVFRVPAMVATACLVVVLIVEGCVKLDVRF